MVTSICCKQQATEQMKEGFAMEGNRKIVQRNNGNVFNL